MKECPPSSRIRVAQVMGTLSRESGGVFEALSLTSRFVRREELDWVVLGLRDATTSHVDLLDAFGGEVYVSKAFGPRSVGFSFDIGRRLEEGNFDVVHQHGIWQAFSRDTCLWSTRRGQPLVIAPHGMLDPWALQRSKLKKALALAVYERRNLQSAACIHALNDVELDAVRSFGLTNPVAVIPNGVSLPRESEALGPPDFLCEEDRRVLLFLGRIHQKKGVVETIEGWARALEKSEGLSREWCLVLAGWGDRAYEDTVKRRVEELKLSEHVYLPGPVHGPEKAALFARSSAFVLASHSEGLPMAVLEAWSYGLPAFISPGCNFPGALETGAAIEVKVDADDISEKLVSYLRGSNLGLFGLKGKELVKSTYEIGAIAQAHQKLYNWLLSGGRAPEFVKMA